MRLGVMIAACVALVLAVGARAIDYVHYPDSTAPVWLSNGLIRFQTNLGTRTQQYEAYVYANDGQRDVVDCGPGDDRVVADRVDVLRHCEHVVFEPPGPSFDFA